MRSKHDRLPLLVLSPQLNDYLSGYAQGLDPYPAPGRAHFIRNDALALLFDRVKLDLDRTRALCSIEVMPEFEHAGDHGRTRNKKEAAGAVPAV